MRKVERNELLGLAEYEQIRQHFFTRMITEKRARRVIVADEVSAIFENHDTVLLQIQEMLRTERISKEPAILHELQTYNELVPGEAELSATMFIEIPDRIQRDRRLTELVGLEGHIALEVLGTRVASKGEQRAVLPDRTTAVHYIRFPLGTELAARLVARAKVDPSEAMYFLLSHPKLQVRKELSAATVKSLAEDLVSS
jgi:hypothetical protein